MYLWGTIPTVIMGPSGPPGPADINSLKKQDNLSDVEDPRESRVNIGIHEYNINEFGADPTGTNDSSGAIFDCSLAATNGGTRFGKMTMTPGATYKCEGVPVVYSNTYIEGAGAIWQNAQLAGSYGGMVGVQIGYSTTTFNENIFVENLTFLGAPNGKQMTLSQMKNCEFFNVRFESDGDPDNQFTISNNNINLKFRNCFFESREIDGYTIRVSGGSIIAIEDCEAFCNGGSFLLANGSGVKGVFVNRLLAKQMGFYLLEGSNCANIIIEKYHISNSGAMIGFGEVASLNSLCADIIIRDGTEENVASPFINASTILCGSQFHGPHGYNALGTGASVATGGQIRLGRLLKDQGTAHISADFTLSAGWGATASRNPSSRDSGGTFSVTAAGAGIVASPTIVLTFKDGTWGTAPLVRVWYQSGGVEHSIRATTISATAVTFTAFFTPVSGTTYTYGFSVDGK